MTTYDEILQRMKNAYFDFCGKDADSMGDTGHRLAAAASEIFSACCTNDFVLRQAFPSSASGEYLDLHAAMRDITRKSAKKAQGSVTFSVSTAADSDIVIPLGTVCSIADEPYIQYSTDEICTIVAGSLSVTVSATALGSGAKYNCPIRSVTKMVNPPTGVETVTNGVPFLGGTDDEDDETLRSRILDSFKITNGISREYIEALVMKNDEILDCRAASPSSGTVEITVRTADDSLSAALSQQVKNSALIYDLLGLTVSVSAAKPLEYSLKINVFDENADAEKIRQAVCEIASGIRIGESVNLEYIEYKLSRFGFCRISSPDENGGCVLCGAKQYPLLTECEVIAVE